ncbi:vesicle trafficking 1 [Oratosquilla oratoria]|uniref:vesicle trafficking 1 n=1 Tax=Oratosquilla oratoria TaxID=337810 RepID=UPI003F76A687
MASPNFPPVPPQLKTVQHYLKIANEYDKREPSISYWIRLYGLQTALKIDRKAPESRALLGSLMDWLENFKKEHVDNEAVTNEMAGHALVENVGHKMFMWADTEDRASRFNKNVVKAFFTAGLLFDVCEVFGELSDEVAAQRKYARWKAAYIHNCLKTGEDPIPGPMGGEEDEFGTQDAEEPSPFNMPVPPPPNNTDLPSVSSTSPVPPNMPPPGASNPPGNAFPSMPPQPQQPMPSRPPAPMATPYNPPPPQPQHTPAGGVTLSPEDFVKAQKYCKYAVSAMDYEDTVTALDNLNKAIRLLTTGKDS